MTKSVILLFLLLQFNACNFESDEYEHNKEIIIEKNEDETTEIINSVYLSQEDTINFLSPEDLRKYKVLENDWQRIIFLMNLIKVSQEEGCFFKFNENSFDDVDTIASDESFPFLPVTKQQIIEVLEIYCQKERNCKHCQGDEIERIISKLRNTKYSLTAEFFKTETGFRIFIMLYNNGETQQIYFQL